MSPYDPAIRTRTLARIVGPYLVIIAVALFARQGTLALLLPAFMQDAPLVLATGAFTVGVGLVMIVTHHQWKGLGRDRDLPDRHCRGAQGRAADDRTKHRRRDDGGCRSHAFGASDRRCRRIAGRPLAELRRLAVEGVGAYEPIRRSPSSFSWQSGKAKVQVPSTVRHAKTLQSNAYQGGVSWHANRQSPHPKCLNRRCAPNAPARKRRRKRRTTCCWSRRKRAPGSITAIARGGRRGGPRARISSATIINHLVLICGTGAHCSPPPTPAISAPRVPSTDLGGRPGRRRPPARLR